MAAPTDPDEAGDLHIEEGLLLEIDVRGETPKIRIHGSMTEEAARKIEEFMKDWLARRET